MSVRHCLSYDYFKWVFIFEIVQIESSQYIGLQRYTKLSSTRCMTSGELTYRIASYRKPHFHKVRELSRTCFCPSNQQISRENSPMFQTVLGSHSFPVKCVWFLLDARICFCAPGASKSKNTNYWKIPS